MSIIKKWDFSLMNRQIPKNEKEFIIKLLDMIDDEPIRFRLSNLIIWYVDHAKHCKLYYYSLNLISLSANIAIPIVNTIENFSHTKITTTALAATASIAMAINQLFHFKDNWTRYRTAAEAIKSAMSEYVIKVKECSKSSESSSCLNSCNVTSDLDYHCILTKQLMSKIEQCTATENHQWQQDIKKYEEIKKNHDI